MTRDSVSENAARTRFSLARAWHSKGVLPAAIAGYREALRLDPGYAGAAILLGALLQSQERLQEAAHVYREALNHNPNEARLHKQLVRTLLVEEGPGAVFEYYRLRRRDSKPIELRASEVICCVVVRNESARLPYFFEYYCRKQIGAFFAVDNGSTDGSVEYLLDQPDTYVWQSDLSFNRANFGAGWFELILRQYGRDHWCLIVDADELLYYPACETTGIPYLCSTLDRRGKRALPAVHLDMYSDRPVKNTHYVSGLPFEQVCPYFDREFFHTCDPNGGPFRNQTVFRGGVRQRIFGESAYHLSKVPLIKYDEDCILTGGQHSTNLPAELISDSRGALLHFKYFASFPAMAAEEVARAEHSDNAALYREYERGFQASPGLSFYHPSHSVRLEGSDQLTLLGVLKDHETTPSPAPSATPPIFPKIERVSSLSRPLWSVILTVYRRVGYIVEALRSVLIQDPGPEQMQIEVICDGPAGPLQAEIESTIRAIAGDRVNVYRHPDRAGQPEIFNVGLARAIGLWVHILHDDDWVAPNFYEAMYRGILAEPIAGAVFCRHTYVDENRRPLRLSFLERETPGILDGWLDRIASSCRLQTPSIAVRREVYERLGGYCPMARSAYDWEMWQRLAVHYPVWYDPEPMAFFRLNGQSESARLTAGGQQIADSRTVIEIARGYLPEDSRTALLRKSGDMCASWALERARAEMAAGNSWAAVALLGEGIRCSRSAEVTEQLFAWLRNFRDHPNSRQQRNGLSSRGAA